MAAIEQGGVTLHTADIEAEGKSRTHIPPNGSGKESRHSVKPEFPEAPTEYNAATEVLGVDRVFRGNASPFLTTRSLPNTAEGLRAELARIPVAESPYKQIRVEGSGKALK